MTKRLGPPPVETLPDVAWGRIERGVWAELDTTATPRRSRRFALWIAAPVALAAGVALWLATSRSAPPTPVVAGDEPTRVVAGATPSAVSFGDAHITVDANSSVVMAGATALVERGAAWFSVAPRGERPPFEVRAGDAIVRVIGTRFHVARDGEQVTVAVDHGVVEVRFRGNAVTLHADQSWTSTKPAEMASAAVPAEPSIDPLIALDPAPARPAPDPDYARYQALEKLEPQQFDVAIKGYLELSKGSSKWAPIALYAAGRLAHDRHDPRAKALLASYLSRFPSGANAAEARMLLAR